MSLTNKIVTAYAKALFQNIQRSKVSQEPGNLAEIIRKLDRTKFVPNVYIVGEELSILGSTINQCTLLKTFIQNPTYMEYQKLETLQQIYPGLTITTNSFLQVLRDRSHLSLISEISDAYNDLLLKFKKAVKVKLITANILQESYGALLLKTLRTVTKSNEIILNVSYNKSLLGGLILEYNSVSTDASILKEFSLFFNE
jgi:ATP synthase F1 delta subunit